MNAPPYIGVTGYTDPDQVKQVTSNVQPSDHLIMCGVVLSNARIRGETSALPNRYPPSQDIPEIFSDQPGRLNIIHYRPIVPDADTLIDAMIVAGPNCHGIQVNTTPDQPWPDPREIAAFRDNANPQRVILQLTRTAISQKNDDAQTIAQVCTQYQHVFTDILIDQSAGNGNPHRMTITLNIAKAISDACPDITVGIAGGLNQHNVATQILTATTLFGHQRFNIDAEGALRDQHDHLDIQHAAAYLTQANNAFNSSRK